ncbi:hypothetical protein [Flavobacterium sp.]|uniref:hypothetical protein n=1 Tax=Flavobacterium sp. TaxID=239 RepID=UPI002BDF81DE|nr:hypothetical protein [Flavobacterium sp.]HSD05953.1 hypothetical protein [Flavobacterium sp.]
MSTPTIPTTYTHRLNPISGFDVDSTIDGGLDTRLSGEFQATHAGSIETKVSGLLQTDSVLKLKGDPNEPVSTDSKIEILNLPRFTLQDIKDMMKTRVRIPNYSNVCIKMLGVEVLSVHLGGESQIITEPYIPNSAERCEADCCDYDDRPFPDNNK